MLTADTITDEQIRDLRASIAGHVFPAAGMAHTGLSELHHLCEIALRLCPTGREPDGAIITAERARARCAEILNARMEAR
jgi:hypothetical protein